MLKITKKKIPYKGKYIKVVEKYCTTDNGKKFVWECVERYSAVFIFAMTKNREVILEKNYRVSLEDYIIETPAGLLDKKGENPKVAAQRELLEETGYMAKKMILVYEHPLEPAIGMQKGFLFFAPNVKLTNKRNLDDAEYIEIIKVPISKLEKFLIDQGKKVKIDVHIWSALALLKNKKLL